MIMPIIHCTLRTAAAMGCAAADAAATRQWRSCQNGNHPSHSVNCCSCALLHCSWCSSITTVTFMPKWQSSITLCGLLQLCTAALQLRERWRPHKQWSRQYGNHSLHPAHCRRCGQTQSRVCPSVLTNCTVAIRQSFIAPCALPQVWANSKQSVLFSPHKLYYRNKAIIHATLCTTAGVGKLKAEGVLQSSVLTNCTITIRQSSMPPCALLQVWANSKQSVLQSSQTVLSQ